MLLMTVSGHLICVPGTLFQGSVKSRIHNYLINLMNVPNEELQVRVCLRPKLYSAVVYSDQINQLIAKFPLSLHPL